MALRSAASTALPTTSSLSLSASRTRASRTRDSRSRADLLSDSTRSSSACLSNAPWLSQSINAQRIVYERVVDDECILIEPVDRHMASHKREP